MPAGVETFAESLANELVRRKVLPAPQAVGIVRQLAHEIAQQHESGRLHLRIAADLVSYEPASGRAALSEPLEESRGFGGVDCDDEFCPPELQQPRAILLPVQLAAARDVMRTSGLSAVDPRRVDLYQLGTLLCRLLTGESVSAFLSRPRVAAKVPAEVRDLIERALGHDQQRALRSVSELLRGLESLDAAVTQELPNVLPGSTRNVNKPDTTPSFVSVNAADTDAGRSEPTPLEDVALPFLKLGHYEIVGRLGRGGMGDVYKGYERRLDRYVAIKVLPSEFSRQDEMVKRFNAEASAAAKLVHPNTVEIYFIGEDVIPTAEGQASSTVHFFAMQFVEGESLADLLARRQRLNVEETLAITEQMLAGLDAAHQRGMVHRDIKPGNILIDRVRQRVQLADFGLVKSLQGSGMTASGVIVGTADYMAPEQGRGAAVDARADLYAVGVVLYQILSGRLPFKADNVTAMIFQHVYETPSPLHEVAAGIPETLAAIVAKLLSKSPDARYQNVGELLADLRAFRQRQPLLSNMPSEGITPGRPRTLIIPAPIFDDGSVLPATLTQITVLSRWKRWQQQLRDFVLIPSEEAVRQIQNTENHVDGAIAEYERRQDSLKSTVHDAAAVLEELETQRGIWQRLIVETDQRATNAPDDDTARAALGEKVRGERVLSELSEQVESQQAQLEEMRHKLSQVTATLERLRSQRDVLNARLKVARAQIHLAGGERSAVRSVRWIAMVRWRNVAQIVVVLAVVAGSSVFVAKAARQVFSDSMFASDTTISLKFDEPLKDATTFNELFQNPVNQFGQAFTGGDTNLSSLALSPTGAHLAAITGGPDVFLWNAETGELLHRLSENLRMVRTLAFSPDGNILVTGEAANAIETSLKFWDPKSGTRIGGIPNVNGFVIQVTFSQKDSLLAYSVLGSEIGVWDYKTNTEVWSIPSSKQVQSLSFTADGSLLVGLLPNRSEVLVWDVGEKKLLRSWFDQSLSTSNVRIGPLMDHEGSGFLVAGPPGITRWDARSGEKRSHVGGTLPKSSGAMSQDGRWLAMSSGDWVVVVDAQTGVPRAIFPGHQTSAMAFSPRGDRLFTAGGPPYVVRWETNSAVPIGKAPSLEISDGPLLAMAQTKPLGLIAAGTQVGLWNYQTRSPAMILASASGEPPAAAAFSHDDRRVAVLDRQSRLQIWDVGANRRIHDTQISDKGDNTNGAQVRFDEEENIVWIVTSTHLWRVDLRQGLPEAWMEWSVNADAFVLSPDLRIVVRSTKVPSQMQAWDISSRQPIFRDGEFPFAFNDFAFTSNSRRLLGLSHSNGYFDWDLERRELLRRVQPTHYLPHDRGKLAFLSDQRHFLLFDESTLSVVDHENLQVHFKLQTPPKEGSLTHGVPFRQLHLTSDGRFVVTYGGSVHRTRFWDLHPQQNLGREILNTGKTNSVSK